MSFEQEKGVYVGRPYMLMYVGFIAVLLLDLVLRQGSLEITGGIEVTVLLIGILGLLVGYMVNMRQIRTGPPTLEDRNKLVNFGIGMFIVVTFIDSLFIGWSQYLQSTQEINMIVTLAAAPFEEALFRLGFASAIYRGTNVYAEKITGSQKVLGRVTSADLVTMIVTSLIVSWLFQLYHAGVYQTTDTLVMSILFFNSFVYTITFLYTGDIMTTTTMHLLHNASALFL